MTYRDKEPSLLAKCRNFLRSAPYVKLLGERSYRVPELYLQEPAITSYLIFCPRDPTFFASETIDEIATKMNRFAQNVYTQMIGNSEEIKPYHVHREKPSAFFGKDYPHPGTLKFSSIELTETVATQRIIYDTEDKDLLESKLLAPESVPVTRTIKLNCHLHEQEDPISLGISTGYFESYLRQKGFLPKTEEELVREQLALEKPKKSSFLRRTFVDWLFR